MCIAPPPQSNVDGIYMPLAFILTRVMLYMLARHCGNNIGWGQGGLAKVEFVKFFFTGVGGL